MTLIKYDPYKKYLHQNAKEIKNKQTKKRLSFEKNCNCPVIRILEKLQKFKLAKNQSGIIWASFWQRDKLDKLSRSLCNLQIL